MAYNYEQKEQKDKETDKQVLDFFKEVKKNLSKRERVIFYEDIINSENIWIKEDEDTYIKAVEHDKFDDILNNALSEFRKMEIDIKNGNTENLNFSDFEPLTRFKKYEIGYLCVVSEFALFFIKITQIKNIIDDNSKSENLIRYEKYLEAMKLLTFAIGGVSNIVIETENLENKMQKSFMEFYESANNYFKKIGAFVEKENFDIKTNYNKNISDIISNFKNSVLESAKIYNVDIVNTIERNELANKIKKYFQIK
ncbi:hypothetical protein HMPREF9309_01334 [Campylobacter ureolyticus ACS-301-V-Sch3b]|uniref:Uncharacterized protein n=1 Tax=Campylobacter ureolyticus ACS-301-V-Sch3b TaxID=883165 RepID=S3XB89_9BACT|nr:hypothetical protein [Campylobacter ureolyticus]EPH08079.1 hypothetical protein HMPREF9309_01334 [Campylobacter ureolyticus ACS-301-V-Sch3b]